MNILFISRFTPYDDIGHAGGKTFNYYLKKLADADGDGIRVVSFCSENNRKKIDLENYGIDDSVLYISDNKIDKIKRRIPDLI